MTSEPHVVEHVLDHHVEGNHVPRLVQLRIDDVTGFRQHRSGKAEFARFNRRNEETTNAKGTRQGLVLCDAVEPANGKRTIRERDVREAGGHNLKPLPFSSFFTFPFFTFHYSLFLFFTFPFFIFPFSLFLWRMRLRCSRIRHDRLLHQLLRRPHHVHRIRRLVGRHAEEGRGGIFEQEVQQLLRHEHVRLAHRLDGVDVAFRPHMLARREVRHDVERTMGLEELLEEPGPEVDWLRDVGLGNRILRARSEFAREFGQLVLVNVDYIHGRGTELPQCRLDVVAANRAGTADDQHFPAINRRMHSVRVLREVRRQQRLGTLRHVFADEPLNVEIQHDHHPFRSSSLKLLNVTFSPSSASTGMADHPSARLRSELSTTEFSVNFPSRSRLSGRCSTVPKAAAHLISTRGNRHRRGGFP